MCEYLKLKTKNWNLYVKCLEFDILKIGMSKYWKKKLQTEMFEY
jgi:hypothetical protein